MARNGSGTMAVVNTFVAGNTITAAGHNQNDVDIAAEITNSVAVDGQSTLTGQLKSANGTVAAPSITFGSDLDTGFYRAAANAVSLSLGGADYVTIATATVAILTALAVSNTVTASNAAAGFIGYEAICTEAGAAVGPIISLYRDSATPAASDVIGSLDYAARDSGNNKDNYARAYVVVTDPTSTSEDAEWRVQVRVAGTLTDRISATATGTSLTGALTGPTNITASAALSGATASGAMIGTQAQMETGTATDTLVAVGRQHFNPRHPKAWGVVTWTAGDPTLSLSSGVSSITDNSIGSVSFNWATAFSSTAYGFNATAGTKSDNSSMEVAIDRVGASYTVQGTTSRAVQTYRYSDGGLDDASTVSVVAFGDFA